MPYDTISLLIVGLVTGMISFIAGRWAGSTAPSAKLAITPPKPRPDQIVVVSDSVMLVLLNDGRIFRCLIVADKVFWYAITGPWDI